jgi:glycosyltransferase involved in cell wall biosynthesis
MTACIYYHPEAYTTTGPQLMGRNAAGESFLRGFLSYSKANEFWIQAENSNHIEQFTKTANVFRPNSSIKVVNKNSLSLLSEPGVVSYPGPGIGTHAFHRTFFGDTAWSLCGITHTTSSIGSMDNITGLITSPVHPWDAIICTSSKVKDNVNWLLESQISYLENRLGVTKVRLPQLPVIPLGLHTDDFIFTDNQKSHARSLLGLNKETIVILYMGRLSFHAKAHPLALYQALELAVKRSGKEVVLVECGWHHNEFIAKAYSDAAKTACPSIRVINLDGRKESDRNTAWASADVLVSLADNIQETFGIVPIEGMAAGIPVIVSDWNGYKDTVRDGVDGYRIPTLMPNSGLGADLAFRHALEIDTYDMYCGNTCSVIAVDIEATTQAFIKLLESKQLRKKLGAQGQKRAKEVYDWSVIIPQYENLWDQLTEIRLSKGQELKPLPHPWPARSDPFLTFSSYPTQALSAQTILTLVDATWEESLKRIIEYKELSMVNFANTVLPSNDEIQTILKYLDQGPKTASNIIDSVDSSRKAFVLRSLTWFVKLGVLKVDK